MIIFYHQPVADSDKARVVGFEVEPFSINHLPQVRGKFDVNSPSQLCDKNKPLLHKFDENYPQKIGMEKISPVVWTYDVVYVSLRSVSRADS